MNCLITTHIDCNCSFLLTLPKKDPEGKTVIHSGPVLTQLATEATLPQAGRRRTGQDWTEAPPRQRSAGFWLRAASGRRAAGAAGPTERRVDTTH